MLFKTPPCLFYSHETEEWQGRREMRGRDGHVRVSWAALTQITALDPGRGSSSAFIVKLKTLLKADTGRRWLIILTLTADTHPPPAVFQRPHVLPGVNLCCAQWFCSFRTFCLHIAERSGSSASQHSQQPQVSLPGCLPASILSEWAIARAGGIVPPRRCMHQEAVNPPPPSICLRLLFPAKQTTRFPMRAPGPRSAASSADMLYGRHRQMKTVKTPFLKRCVCAQRRAGLGPGLSYSHQTRRRAINRRADRALSFFWIRALIHSTDKQLRSNFILIHLPVHASPGQVEKPRPSEENISDRRHQYVH